MAHTYTEHICEYPPPLPGGSIHAIAGISIRVQFVTPFCSSWIATYGTCQNWANSHGTNVRDLNTMSINILHIVTLEDRSNNIGCHLVKRVQLPQNTNNHTSRHLLATLRSW